MHLLIPRQTADELTPHEIEHRFKIKVEVLYRLRKRGNGPKFYIRFRDPDPRNPYSPKKRVVYRLSDLEEWLKLNEKELALNRGGGMRRALPYVAVKVGMYSLPVQQYTPTETVDLADLGLL
jgi:hypothetical protein